MTDITTMMREQARAGLQLQLDAAVTDGNTEAARKISDDLAKLAVTTAPKAPPFGDVEIRAELDKQTWFGTDPKRSAKAVEFGKTMDPKKFATAEAFATAIVKAVDEEFKPTVAGEDDDKPGEDDDDKPGEDDGKRPAGKRRTDGPNDADTLGRSTARRAAGPWTKLADAPADVQKEIKRQESKFVSAAATKEQRENYVTKALEAHYAAHQRKGKK